MARTLKAKDPAKAKPSKPKILIFGPPNVKKTSVSLDFPSAYYIDCEGGANLPYYTDKLRASGGVYLGVEDGANDFGTVTDEIITLATTKHPYRTLVIDSYSKIFNTQIVKDYERMEKAGRDMDKTFGAEKKGALNATRRWLTWFEKLDMNVILICHEKELWKDGKSVGTTFDGWDKLAHELHLNLQIYKSGASCKARVIKTRLEGFPDAANFEWTYDEFARRYGRDVIEAEAVPSEPPTEEQILDYTGMLDVMKVPQNVLDKWAEVEFADLTGNDLQRRIDYLNKLKEGAK